MAPNNDDRDGFWDIEKLLPRKKDVPMRPFSTKEKLTELTVSADAPTDKGYDRRLTFIPDADSEAKTLTYTLNGGFIRSVTITRFVDKYDFYGNFRKAALLYYEFKTPKCDFVPFYSYMPQYSQFNSAQKSFYFYFRDCVRRRKYIKTDYSYLYLYVYEILNLPDKISRDEGLELLIDLWRAYRGELPNIDANMSLWVQDYCLVYGLPSPTDKISDFIFDVISVAELREFYLSDVKGLGTDGINAMLACLSDYDWRRGKYAGGEGREVYSKHMLGAMGLLLSRLWHDGLIINTDAEPERLVRSAFRNSLCTHSVKCRLDIEYIPISKATEQRRTVTAAIRYTENKLRALLGVKSRLTVKELPAFAAEIIDSYFESVFARAESERKKAQMPEYERLYDAASTGISFSGADEIERASWTTTARLVDTEEIENGEAEAFECEAVSREQTELAEPDAAIPTVQIADTAADSFGLSPSDAEFVRLVLLGDTEGIGAFCEACGVLADALADKINEAFSDGFGDVIMECNEGELKIIEDYTEDVEEWLTRQMR